jgi:hypothetical protein
LIWWISWYLKNWLPCIQFIFQDRFLCQQFLREHAPRGRTPRNIICGDPIIKILFRIYLLPFQS